MQDHPHDHKKPIKKSALAVFFLCFAVLWIGGLTAGITAAACQKERYYGATKLRFCNLSYAVGSPFDLLAGERAKRSIIHLERGIAYAQLRELGKAQAAFVKALEDAVANGGHRSHLYGRMNQIADPAMQEVWQQLIVPDR